MTPTDADDGDRPTASTPVLRPGWVRRPKEEPQMLLSRIAESVYWAGRYLERAEATARLLRVHTELFLDLPRSAGIGWTPLLAVTGSGEAFHERHPHASEEQVIGFLSIDVANSGSILSSLSAARANFRVTRAVFPSSSWEVLNALHTFASSEPDAAISRRSRLQWMDHIVHQCQMLNGLLASVMSHDAAYSFLEIGRFIERADMTTRILDVQSGLLLGAVHDGMRPYTDVLWVNLLRSLSGHQMFVRTMGVGVAGPESLRFLLKDPQFPRSVEHSLTEIARALLELPRYDGPMGACARAQAMLEDIDVAALAESGLHEYVDLVQIGLAALHEQLASTYFGLSPSQTQVLASA